MAPDQTTNQQELRAGKKTCVEGYSTRWAHLPVVNGDAMGCYKGPLQMGLTNKVTGVNKIATDRSFYNPIYSSIVGPAHLARVRTLGIFGVFFLGEDVKIVFITGWWFQPLLKNITEIGSLPQVGLKCQNIWNHHPD